MSTPSYEPDHISHEKERWKVGVRDEVGHELVGRDHRLAVEVVHNGVESIAKGWVSLERLLHNPVTSAGCTRTGEEEGVRSC